MSKLITLNKDIDNSLLDDLLNNELTIYEDIQGSKIFVNWNGKDFTIIPKNRSNEPINIIDLSIQKYYNSAVNYFNSIDDRVKGLLNHSWYFIFEYFPDQFPANIEYNRVPKNNLVLCSILKGNKYTQNVDEIDEYSRLLEVDSLPVIFKGKLGEKASEAIKYFLNTSEEDLEYVFGDKSFLFFFYKILNPQIKNSFLMTEDNYQENVEKLIIKVDNKELSFQLLNPLYKRISDSNSTEFVEIYSLILVNFLNFSHSVNLNSIKLKGNKKEEVYIYLICKLYNMYISEVKDDLLNFDFVIPDFFDKSKFRINTELIDNKLTKEYISESKKLEYIFKCVLSSFKKKRKKPVGVFTEKTLDIFNKFVDKIESSINEYLNKKGEAELTKNKLVDFSKYFDIKVDKDANNDVYPDIYDEIQKKSNNKDKDKKDIKYQEVDKTKG